VRIAVIGTRGVPATFGGIEHHVEEIGARLAARGHDVTVFARSNYVTDAVDSYRGMRVTRLSTVSSKHLDALVHSALATGRALGRRFDVVHYHALGPGALTPVPRFASHAKVVQTIHGRDDQRAKWGPAARTFLRTAGWLSARVPDATVVVSRALLEDYRARYGRTAVYIANGVEDPGPPPPPGLVHERFGVAPDEYLLFVGRLVPEKAPDLLVRAFRRLPGNLRLVIAGGSSFSDRYTAELAEQAAADNRVVVPGYVYGDDLHALYAHARAFVLPSFVEGMPLTLLEAAAHGTPIVASAIAPHLEILGGDGPGRRLFPAGDEARLLAALSASIDGGDAERVGAAVVRDSVLASYGWDAAADATESLYKELLAG
jgi:glycosyltransferase involved in cell wall biosynthesis